MCRGMGVWCIRDIGMEGYGCAGVWVCRGPDMQEYRVCRGIARVQGHCQGTCVQR